ncbi:hypothetical protein FJ970_32385 (plasmid) [Mesorhizobium sp. B2-1-8]|uniref:hypothetical protein n=1 Tax=Mesorhizobium sp. B2-1-8 TaxID=2589967 RepID=UPI001128500F|nr:hypothetical protein [Mesorhizobium sp. B2-1-8]UCI22632.1 hypothetical protein FJ970_32385 [Mesorhizobium sp. B2-1-8]
MAREPCSGANVPYRPLPPQGRSPSGDAGVLFFRIAASGDPNRDAQEYGDRTVLITISTTASITGGAITDPSGGVQFFGGESTKDSKFDLGTGKILTGLHWLQDGTNLHGTWVFEGSNDDSTYTGQGSSFTLGGALITEVTWSNSTAYRYYKLRQISGSTSTRVNLETEFRIT